MFLGAKIRQISYISKYFLAINVSSTKYSYISKQRELPSMSKISSFSNLPPILGFSGLCHTAGVSLRSPPACGLPALRACFSFSPSNKKGITELTESRLITLCASIRLKGILMRIMNFARKPKPKRKNSFTLFSALREIVKQRET